MKLGLQFPSKQLLCDRFAVDTVVWITPTFSLWTMDTKIGHVSFQKESHFHAFKISPNCNITNHNHLRFPWKRKTRTKSTLILLNFFVIPEQFTVKTRSILLDKMGGKGCGELKSEVQFTMDVFSIFRIFFMIFRNLVLKSTPKQLFPNKKFCRKEITFWELSYFLWSSEIW